jgi:hypothetical protein
MAVKLPSALHQKGLKKYTQPDASSLVTEEETLHRLRQIRAVGSACVHYRPAGQSNQNAAAVVHDRNISRELAFYRICCGERQFKRLKIVWRNINLVYTVQIFTKRERRCRLSQPTVVCCIWEISTRQGSVQEDQ